MKHSSWTSWSWEIHRNFSEKALRRRWEAALEERDALQIQMNNMEKDPECCLNFVRNPNKLLFIGKFWLTSKKWDDFWSDERSFFRDFLWRLDEKRTGGEAFYTKNLLISRKWCHTVFDKIYIYIDTWRIIPLSKWLKTMVSKSPKWGSSPSKWPKWLINRGY